MELLLNLAWLFLALPACWLWRDSRTAPARRKISSFHCLLTVSCMLVILFPVISATDDLRAMSAEMEESPASKRSVSQSNGDKPSAAKWQHQPGVPFPPVFVVPPDRNWLSVPVSSLFLSPASAVKRPSRAPPHSELA